MFSVFMFVSLDFGIKAPPAERHWRLFRLPCCVRRVWLASKPPQPKGIGDLASVKRALLWAIWHQSPPSRKALETKMPPTCSLIASIWHQSPPSRKALETGFDLRQELPELDPASKPPQPKGIGDDILYQSI